MKRFRILLFILLGWSAQSAYAAGVCTFTTMGGTLVDFGLYVSGAGPRTGMGTINFSCIPTLPAVTVSYTVGVSSGLANNFNPRRLYLNGDTGTGASLSYNLFSDNARTQIIGTGMPGEPATSMMSNCTGACNYQIFGQLFGNSTVIPGMYSDIVVVTLNF